MDTSLKIILTVTLITIVIHLFKWIHALVRTYFWLSKLPGPARGGILIGNMSYLQATPEIMFRRLREAAKTFYPAYKFHALLVSSAHLLKPEDCELVLSNPVHNEKGYMYKLLHKWLRFGLLTSSGTKWQTRRRILTPAFHFNVLEQFISVFNDEAEKFVTLLRSESEGQVNVTPMIMQFTLKIIAETAMGTKLDFRSQKEKDYKKAVYDIGRILVYRFNHPWCIDALGNLLSPYFFEERRVTKVLHNFTKNVIKEKERNFDPLELPKEEHDVYKGKKRLAMLDLLLNAKRQEKIIDDEGIQEEVDTFMFEGHDTTAVALSYTLMLLANHKDVQDNIYQELIDVLGDVHKKPTYNDLQNFKYMERCIKESLRLYPSVYFISRTLGEDVKLTNGYLLPKHGMVVIHIYDIHRNPDIYPDPEKFDPDRFLPENCKNRHPFAYFPFSAGQRNCIGQKFAMLELKVAVSAILANFVLEPIDTPATIEPIADIVLRSKKGIKVRFVPRE